jgi:hypothetical protein
MDARRIATGIALMLASLMLVLLHKFNYSRENQFFGIALVGTFGLLFLTHKLPGDETWWL